MDQGNQQRNYKQLNPKVPATKYMKLPDLYGLTFVENCFLGEGEEYIKVPPQQKQKEKKEVRRLQLNMQNSSFRPQE